MKHRCPPGTQPPSRGVSRLGTKTGGAAARRGAGGGPRAGGRTHGPRDPPWVPPRGDPGGGHLGGAFGAPGALVREKAPTGNVDPKDFSLWAWIACKHDP